MAQQRSIQEQFDLFLGVYSRYQVHATKAETYLKAQQELTEQLRSVLRQPNRSPHTIILDTAPKQRRALGEKALELFAYDEERANEREQALQTGREAEQVFRSLGNCSVTFTPLSEAADKQLLLRSIHYETRKAFAPVEGLLQQNFKLKNNSLPIAHWTDGKLIYYAVPIESRLSSGR